MDLALPVLLDVADPLSQRVRAWFEGTLGWQVVDDATAGVVPPVCAFVDVRAAADPALPAVLLVGRGDDSLEAARAAARIRPVAVARWPEDRDLLPALAERAGRGGSAPGSRAEELRIGAATGGVGATTVSLALGGLLAWRGRSVLALTSGAVPVDGVRTLASDDLAGSGTWRAATPTPGCSGLRVLRCRGGLETATVDAGPATAVVRDLGDAESPDVLVLRRDRAGLEAVEVTTAGLVVVTDDGVVPLDAVRRAAGRRRILVLERSVRVARAVANRRVPASLPGRWLRGLAAALDRGPQPAVGPAAGRGA